MRKWGVCTWVFGETPLEAIASRVAALGYDGLELPGDPDRYPPAMLKRLISDHGLSVLSLDPSSGPVEADLAHPDPAVRQVAVSHFCRVLDYAAEIGTPTVVCHGLVGRVRAISSQKEEELYLTEGVAKIADRAGALGIRVACEVLNRYESHLVNTAAQARAMMEEIDSPSLGVLLDTYHMNIEEADLPSAIRTVQRWLCLFHVADSNRRAVGRGHVPFGQVISTLQDIGYEHPLVVECTAPGPDPFTPIKGMGWQEAVWDEVETSLQRLRKLTQNVG